MRKIVAIGLASLISSPALAGLNVRFVEGAPKDRFTISPSSGCDLGPMTLTIDLAPSPYGLIFDTTSRGAGVDVFQPLEITHGRNRLTALPTVKDGDNVIKLDIAGLPNQEKISFTIDVDDTAKNREITVSDAEIRGAQVTALYAGSTSEAVFGDNATASIGLSGCTS